MITEFTLIQSLILGVLQGFTEFLPISSSGHLVVAEALLGIKKSGITFEVFVHFGTLISIIVMFRSQIGELFLSFIKVVKNPRNIAESYRSDNQFKLFILLLLATIPAGIIGILFKESLENLFNEPKFVGYSFIFTGIVLIYSVNVLRISILAIALYKYPQFSNTLHGVVFPAIIYGMVFLLWMIWVRMLTKTETENE